MTNRELGHITRGRPAPSYLRLYEITHFFMPQLSLIENIIVIIILATLFDLCGNISCEVSETRSLKQFSHAMKTLLDAKLMSNHWHVCSIVLVFLEHD